MELHIFEDSAVRGLEPLSLTRPAFDLHCGTSSLLGRQRRWFNAGSVAASVAPERAAFCRLACPDVRLIDAAVRMSSIKTIVNARWLAPTTPPGRMLDRGVYLIGEDVAYAVLGPNDRMTGDGVDLLAGLPTDLPRQSAEGFLIRYPWELVEHNAEFLTGDAAHWDASWQQTPLGPDVSVIGPRVQLFIEPGARIEPQVVFDTSRGPVIIDGDVVVQAFSRIEGPCYIGPRTQLLAARIKNASIGPECRIGGEVESTIVQGYSNKAHEGFLGHSYVGEWVNLGAGTFTSDLRTDYGSVQMTVDGAHVDSGQMKIGAFIGDHVKTSIGTLLNTGSTVGPFSLLLASGTLLPREIPSFCRYGHGRLHERTDLGQMFETAAIAMGRRGREWSDSHAEAYLDLYERTASSRARSLRENDQRRLRRVV